MVAVDVVGCVGGDVRAALICVEKSIDLATSSRVTSHNSRSTNIEIYIGIM